MSFDNRGLCTVCKKNLWDWVGYDNPQTQHFCEECKEKFIKFAMDKYGVKFAIHDPDQLNFDSGIKDGFTACPITHRDKILEIWKEWRKTYGVVLFVFR